MKAGFVLRALTSFAVLCLLVGCETMPSDAFRLSETALAIREMQSREYYGVNDAAILSASMAVLQDMGYTIDEIEKPLGVLSASKRADATNLLEAIGKTAIDTVRCMFTMMLACSGRAYGKVDDVQDIRLTLITRPQRDNGDDVAVRVTIQRVIWDKEGRLSEQQTISDGTVYVAFFEKLSKAVFLEQENI